MYQIPQTDLATLDLTNTKTRQLILDVCLPPLELEAVKDQFCGSNFFCDDSETVFGLVGDNVPPHKRDFSSFIARGSNIVFTLLSDCCTEIATLDDNTLGTYYATFTVQPTYSGFLLDWTKVLDSFGVGDYKVRASFDYNGTSYTIDSHQYHLYNYDPEIANRTVKLEYWQDGNLVNSIFDYTDLLPDGWYNSVRLPAIFGKFSPEVTKDDYKSNSYALSQNRDELTLTYTLNIELISEKQAFNLINNALLGNRIEITDYDLSKNKVLRSVPVFLDDISSFEHTGYGSIFAEINFKEATQNRIKRNF